MTSIAAKLRWRICWKAAYARPEDSFDHGTVDSGFRRRASVVGTYDRKLTDIFKVQDEISTTVAKALNIALIRSPLSGGQVVSHGTSNVEAYNLMLQGNYFFFAATAAITPKLSVS